MGTKRQSNFEDLIDFTRASGGTALRPVSYGSELVTNGTFDTDTSGWTDGSTGTGSISWASGEISISRGATSSDVGRADQSISTEAGKVYFISFAKTSGTGAISLFVGTSQGGSQISSAVVASDDGIYTLSFVAQSDTTWIALRSSTNNATATIDNVSLTEVTFDEADGTLTLFEHPNNIPRIEYDSSGNRLGLLIEESRTNLLPYSANLANWSGQYATVTSGYTAPDGSSDACLLSIPSTANDRITETVTATSTSATLSVFVKAGPNSNGDFKILLRNATTATNLFNTTLTITDGVAVNNGWYRHDLTASSGITAGNSLIYYLYVDGANTVGSDNYFWGGQLEAGSFPTSYIPTSGATTTRSADVASISTDAFGYNQSAGSVVVEAQSKEVGVNRLYALTEDGGIQDAVYSYAGSSGHLIIRANNVTEANIDAGTFVADTYSKLAATYKANDSAVTIDGGTVQTDTSVNLPTTVNTMFFGASSTTANHLNGHIKSIKYYPRRLTNAQLVEITS